MNIRLSRNFSFALGEDTILATYGSAHRDGSCLIGKVTEVEGRILIVVSSERLVREQVPVSTRLDGIVYIRLDECSVGAILCRSDNSAFCYSSKLDSLIGIESNIQVVQRSRSEVAVVYPFVDASTSRDREHHRECDVEWALECNSCCNPSDRVRWVVEGKLNLLFVSLNRSDIEVEPLCVARIDGSTLGPIELACIVATKRKAIVDINTELDRLVGSYLEVHLCNIAINNLVNQLADYARNGQGEISPSRNRESNLGESLIVAANTSSDADISSLRTVVNERNLWEVAQRVKHLVGDAIPLCSTSSLLVRNALLNSGYIAAISTRSS